LADALDSGSSSRKGVEVQVLSSAPTSYGVFAVGKDGQCKHDCNIET
jgi:hypothetical protein